MTNPGILYEWIEALPTAGRYTFSRADAEAATNASRRAVQATLRRLKKRGIIACPLRGFYVVVPAEYRSAGCPPATWFIDDLMGHLGKPYYVGLLTAAALHGAGHQQPMAFQVITDTAQRDIEVQRVRVDFRTSHLLEGAGTLRMQTETGSMRVATPETTAFDLVRFPSAVGYWSNIATVLSELAEAIDPRRLVAGAARVSRSDVQRLGWLLDLIGENALAEPLAVSLAGRRLALIPLNPRRAVGDARSDRRWRILINDVVEPDP